MKFKFKKKIEFELVELFGLFQFFLLLFKKFSCDVD